MRIWWYDRYDWFDKGTSKISQRNQLQSWKVLNPLRDATKISSIGVWMQYILLFYWKISLLERLGNQGHGCLHRWLNHGWSRLGWLHWWLNSLSQLEPSHQYSHWWLRMTTCSRYFYVTFQIDLEFYLI